MNLRCNRAEMKAVEYDEYKDMKTKDIAALVKERIEEKIKEILG